jgi:hypothetical protein
MRLKITRIEEIDGPFDYKPDIEEGDVVKVGLGMGARPAKKMELPGESHSNNANGTTVSATTEWSEWNNTGFVFKQRASNYDEKKVVETLPGIDKGDKASTTLNIPLREGSNATVTARKYKLTN